LEEDTNLMPHHREFDLPDSIHPDDEQVLNDQGCTEIFGGQPEAEV